MTKIESIKYIPALELYRLGCYMAERSIVRQIKEAFENFERNEGYSLDEKKVNGFKIYIEDLIIDNLNTKKSYYHHKEFINNFIDYESFGFRLIQFLKNI